MGEGAKRLAVTIRTSLKETSVSCVGGLGNLASGGLTRGLSGHDSCEARTCKVILRCS